MPYSAPAGNAIAFTFQGASAYSPFSQSYDGLYDWEISWTRRTRVQGEWRDYVDVPIGETIEKYEVEIWDSSYTTLKRTLTVFSPSATYTHAEQKTDFGLAQATLYLRIYQISEVLGRGTVFQTSITR